MLTNTERDTLFSVNRQKTWSEVGSPNSKPLQREGGIIGREEARTRVVLWQAIFLLGIAGALVFSLCCSISLVKKWLALGWVVCYSLNNLYRWWLAWQAVRSARRQPLFLSAPPLADAELPGYTILLPLYREGTTVSQLVQAISAVDYPRDLLQVLCLLRADDDETRAALESLSLPPYFNILELPSTLPVGTKPAACNYGLAHARGELLVTFDAEDVPESDRC